MSGPQQGFMNEMESTDHVSGHFEDEHERSAYIQELRNRFRPPSSPTGRVALYIQTMLCKWNPVVAAVRKFYSPRCGSSATTKHHAGLCNAATARILTSIATHKDLTTQEMCLQVEFLLGGYILDTWETVLVYPAYLLIVVLFIYGIYRQLHNGWILLSNTLGL